MWKLAESFVRSLEILTTCEELTRERAQWLTITFRERGVSDVRVVPQGYELTFGRNIMDWPVHGGSYAKVVFCRQDQICGGEVLFRQIEGIDMLDSLPSTKISEALDAELLFERLEYGPMELGTAAGMDLAILCRGRNEHQTVAYPMLSIHACDADSNCASGSILRVQITSQPPDGPRQVSIPWHIEVLERLKVERQDVENAVPVGCGGCK
jgi:hypothetical protein